MKAPHLRYCVFSGSSLGLHPEYAHQADDLGRLLVASGIGLVYGGASVGLMGVVADSVLRAGGEVIGVIPQFLVDREVAHTGLSDLRVTASMHERKALMADLSDGFIALPGGIGTLEELFEVWTWTKLGHHAKPCALLNTEGFYDGLAAFLDSVVAQGFLEPHHRGLLINERTPNDILTAMSRQTPAPPEGKWTDHQ